MHRFLQPENYPQHQHLHLQHLFHQEHQQHQDFLEKGLREEYFLLHQNQYLVQLHRLNLQVYH